MAKSSEKQENGPQSGEGQPPQGHHVDGEPHSLEEEESRPDGDWDGCGDDEGTSDVPQEDKQYHYRQDPPYEGDLLYLFDGFPDEIRGIAHKGEGYPFGKLTLEPWKYL